MMSLLKIMTENILSKYMISPQTNTTNHKFHVIFYLKISGFPAVFKYYTAAGYSSIPRRRFNGSTLKVRFWVDEHTELEIDYLWLM